MKKINFNKSSDLEKLQESINKIFETRINNAKREESIGNFKKASIGSLNDVFNSVTDKLFETSGGKKVIAKYVKLLKENKDLRDAFAVYQFATSPEHINNTSLFLSETINIASGIDKKKMMEGKNSLSKIVAEAVKLANIGSDDIESVISENREVNDAIDYILNNKKTAKNLYEYVRSVEVIAESITKNMPEDSIIGESESVKELSDKLSKTISESSLEPWESKTIWDVVSAKLSRSKGSELFEDYKKRCIDTMDSIIESCNNVEEKSRISAMRQQLEEKKFSDANFVDDILNLSKLQHTLSE